MTTDFLYDGSSTVQELSGGTVQANLLLGIGIDEVLLRTETASTRSFLADGLGSTLALTDSAGTVQTEYTYEPFGNTTTSGITSANPSQYTGRENDGTGLYYYRARYYHPGLQRFISQDPIGFGGGDVTLYAYVNNSPLRWSDPLGLGQFAERILEGMLYIHPGFGGDTRLSHEQYLFDDGTGGNIGHFNDGVHADKPENLPLYKRFGPEYDDKLMHEAVKRVDPGKYCVIGNNCHDYADKLREEYERLNNPDTPGPEPDPDPPPGPPGRPCE